MCARSWRRRRWINSPQVTSRDNRGVSADHLDMVLASGYVSKLLRNGEVVGYLAKNFSELLFEFQKITEADTTAA
jgi:hypothetical protein